MRYRIFLPFAFCFIFFGKGANAQLVAPNVFLQGHWLEVGIAANGSWGPGPSPTGYHAAPSYGGGIPTTGGHLAMVYDFGHDGWTVGSPIYFGDYTYPGTPFEGWAMQANGARSDAFYTSPPGAAGASFDNGTAAVSALTGSNTGYTNAGGIITGIWDGSTTGSSGGLQIHQVTRVDTNASWAVITTTFKNTSGAAIPGVYYWRTCDPDDDVTHTGSYNTTNSITYQNDADHRVMVSSTGVTYTNAFLGLATKDCRAKAMIYQSWATYPALTAGNSLDNVYNGTSTGLGGTWYNQGDITSNQDIAIGLIYNLGTINAGDSAIISYAYIFSSSSDIDSALPDPQLVVNGTPIAPIGPAPAPTIDTFNPCASGLETVPVSIINASDKDWSWSTWTWSPAIGLATTTGVTNTINPGALAGPTTYTITGTDSNAHMYSCNQRVMYLTIIPCFSATNNSTLCPGDTLKLAAHGDSTGATYIWFGPGATGPIVGAGQFLNIPNIVAADSGLYFVVKTVGGSHDTVSTRVFINPAPVVTATSNAPICSGNTLMLYANPDSVGETFSWTGPNSFVSGTQNPTIGGIPVSGSGTYKVTTMLHNCVDSGFVTVVIDSTPEVPTVSSNSPVCSGNTLSLNSGDNTAGVTFGWAGPGGYTSGAQNTTITPVHISATGIYTVTATLGMCHAADTISVLIDSTPVLPSIASNAPICSGSALNLTASSSAGSAYSWSGPNGFSSTLQNPVINPAITVSTGVYSVFATANGCTSPTATLYVLVDSTPAIPVVTSNSPGVPSICEGDTLRLYATDTTAGVAFTWSGPNAFTSSIQNPYIANVTVAADGVYTVTIYQGTCMASAVTTVSITPSPAIMATNNGPICTGNDTLELFVNGAPGATYVWSGPHTFASYVQNPVRYPPIPSDYGGIYVVTETSGVCTKSVNDTVVVNPTPGPPWMSWLTYCQYYDAPPLQLNGYNILWYPTSTGGVGSTIPPVPPTSADTVMWFFGTQTINGCTSPIDSFKVTVNPKPNISLSPSVDLCPRDSATLVASDTDAQTTYNWKPLLYLSDTGTASVVVHPETNETYTVVVTNKYHCTDTATVSVIVHPGAVIFMDDSVTIYPGETYDISLQTNCNAFLWTPSAGLNNPYISDPVASPDVSTRYYVTGTTSWGCSTVDSIYVNVDLESIMTVPNAFAPGTGPNGLFKILKRGEATLSYFRIWNRWGNKVFETSDIDQGWDGTYKGTPQPFGVYVYEIGAVLNTGRNFTKHGNVTLIR